MPRAATTLLMLFATLPITGLGQTSGPSRVERRGVSLLFEAAMGARLNPQPEPGPETAPWHLSWELGPMVQRGNWAVGATGLMVADFDSQRYGIRPRYRRWLGSSTALDLGAGVLLAGGTNYGEQHFPGFAGLVGISYGDALGLNVELHAVRKTSEFTGEYDPVTGRNIRVEATDVAWLLSARARGKWGVVVCTLQLLAALAVAASYDWSGFN